MITSFSTTVPTAVDIFSFLFASTGRSSSGFNQLQDKGERGGGEFWVSYRRNATNHDFQYFECFKFQEK